MADAKITALTALAAAATGDILPIVDDPTGVPETKKITVANLAASIPLDTLGAPTNITTHNASSAAHGLLPKLANTSYSFLNGLGAYDTNLADGWISRGDTWTYASASTFTVSGDVTSIFQKGRKLKLTQTTVKYFYVVSSSYSAPNTTVTITGGSDYTLVSAAITNNYYSYATTPAGFPDWFAYTVAWTGAGGNPAIVDGTLTGRFTMRGKTVLAVINVMMGASTTYGSGNWSFSLPIKAAAFVSMGLADLRDAGTNNYARLIRLGANATAITEFIQLDNASNVNNISSTVPWTWAANDTLRMQIEYEAA